VQTQLRFESLERFYHRVEAPKQTASDARKQQDSAELWGYPPQGSEIPTVQAYDGRLPASIRGIEFTTIVLPDARSAPGQPRWSGPRPGVRVENGVAKISVTITKNTQTPVAEGEANDV
jgi:hypothetical protein